MIARRIGVVALAVIAGAGVLGGACADVGAFESGVCGNGVVESEAQEDCDGAHGCSSSDATVPCSWRCDAEFTCPNDFSCGVDGVCRRPAWSFALGPELDGGWRWATLRDFDQDGRADLLRFTESFRGRTSVTYFDDDGAVASEWSKLGASLRPAVGDIDDDGYDDLIIPNRTPDQTIVQRPGFVELHANQAGGPTANPRSFALRPVLNAWRSRQIEGVFAQPNPQTLDDVRVTHGGHVWEPGVVADLRKSVEARPLVGQPGSLAYMRSAEQNNGCRTVSVFRAGPTPENPFPLEVERIGCSFNGSALPLMLEDPSNGVQVRWIPWVGTYDVDENGVDDVMVAGVRSTLAGPQLALWVGYGTEAGEINSLPPEADTEGDNGFAADPLISVPVGFGGLGVPEAAEFHVLPARVDADGVLDLGVVSRYHGDGVLLESTSVLMSELAGGCGIDWTCACTPTHDCRRVVEFEVDEAVPISTIGALGDFSGDGRLDVAVSQRGWTAYGIQRDFGFDAVFTELDVPGQTSTIAGDFDSDGIADLAVVSSVAGAAGRVYVRWGGDLAAEPEVVFDSVAVDGLLAVRSDGGFLAESDRLVVVVSDPVGGRSGIIEVAHDGTRRLTTGIPLSPNLLREYSAWGHFTDNGPALALGVDPFFGDIVRLESTGAGGFSPTISQYSNPMAEESAEFSVDSLEVVVGDFDADGFDEFVWLTTMNTPGPKVVTIGTTNEVVVSVPPAGLDLDVAPVDWTVVDLDDDGRDEILVVTRGTCGAGGPLLRAKLTSTQPQYAVLAGFEERCVGAVGVGEAPGGGPVLVWSEGETLFVGTWVEGEIEELSSQGLPLAPTDLEIGDVNGDGLFDVVARYGADGDAGDRAQLLLGTQATG